MATWTGQYIQITGISSLTDLANTTTAGGLSLSGVLSGDDQVEIWTTTSGIRSTAMKLRASLSQETQFYAWMALIIR